MPIFNNQKPSGNVGVRPSGDYYSDLLHRLPPGETIGRFLLAERLGIPLAKLPPQTAVPGGDPLMVLPDGAARSISADPDPVARFQRDYCSVPPGGFASQAELDAWNLSRGWCEPATGPITSAPGPAPTSAREQLRIRLGLDPANMPTVADGVSDQSVIDLLTEYAVGPAGDAGIRTKFQTLFCVLPNPMPTDNASIDAWNLRNRWCVPIPRIATGTAPARGGRAALQTQLGLPSLPSIIDLTDETANAILALPAAQMVDAFRTRFCNPPAFRSEAERALWAASHPYCPAPPAVSMTRSPLVWIAGAAVVGTGAWWLLKKSKKKKA